MLMIMERIGFLSLRIFRPIGFPSQPRRTLSLQAECDLDLRRVLAAGPDRRRVSRWQHGTEPSEVACIALVKASLSNHPPLTMSSANSPQ